VSRPNAEHEDTKHALIRVATRLFSKHGYRGTSVKQISDAAGVNISLVSYHFGGKENLYHACLTPWVESKIEFLEKKILRPTSIEEFQFRLKLFVETVMESELDYEDAGCIIWRDIDHDDPVLQDIFKTTIQPLSDRLVDFMRTGQKQNFIRKDLDATIVALLFLGGVQHAIRIDKLRHNLQGETLHDPKVRQKTIQTALEMFFHGMGA
jgi:AcrR family transcriptional regulator